MRSDPRHRGLLATPLGFALLALLLLAASPSSAVAQSPLDKVNAALKKARENQAKAKAANDSAKALVKDVSGSTTAATPDGGTSASANPPGGGPTLTGPGPAAPAAAPAPASAPASAPAGNGLRVGTAKIEEQIVAPNEQGMSYAVSPTGVHVLAISQKGSRYVVVHDGVEGPKFDEILTNGAGGRVNFSPDGKRVGYGARLGQEYVVMVDGKEVGRGPIPGTGKQFAFSGVLFSPNSQHWLYHTDILGRGVGDPPSRWYWDGVAGPVGAERNIAVSPDGNRHAYIAHTPNTNQWTLIVDGKPAGYVGSDPQFSADGKHLFTSRVIPVAVGRPAMELLMDGRPIVKAEKATLHLPPAGDQAIVQVQRSDPAGGPATSFLVIGGKKVEGSEIQGLEYGPIWFSADGKHYAARSGQSGSRETLLVDGRRSPDYVGIDSVWFTDAGTVVYTARAGAKFFVVTGDQESEGQSHAVQRGRGNRVGYTSADQSSNFVVVDGKVTRLPGRIDVSDFTFSPDGTRFAYFQGPLGGGGGNVFIDHVAGPPSSLQPFADFQKGWPQRYIWSPDSKYTVHYGSPGNTGYTGDFGFFIGDRFISRGKQQNVMAPTFSPDSRHLFWMAYAGQRSMMEVWLDGKMIYEFDAQGMEPLRQPGTWEMGADGVLTFLIQTVDGFKRVRITPGPENGFEALMAQGKVAKK